MQIRASIGVTNLMSKPQVKSRTKRRRKIFHCLNIFCAVNCALICLSWIKFRRLPPFSCRCCCYQRCCFLCGCCCYLWGNCCWWYHRCCYCLWGYCWCCYRYCLAGRLLPGGSAPCICFSLCGALACSCLTAVLVSGKTHLLLPPGIWCRISKIINVSESILRSYVPVPWSRKQQLFKDFVLFIVLFISRS